jgi:hypothetical protein
MKKIIITLSVLSICLCGSSRKYGDTYYHDDGSTSRTYGNTTYHSDGNTSREYGNTLYNSDCSSNYYGW